MYIFLIVTEILSKDFQCTVCDRAFTTKRALQLHYIHHREKKFLCSVCDKAFVSKSLLKNHLKV